MPAPQANAMAAVVRSMMGTVEAPWFLYGLGAVIAVLVEMTGVSSLAFALGMYLPLELNSPILLGAVVAWIVRRSARGDKVLEKSRNDRGTLVASGLIDVAQAFPLTLGANIGTTVTAVLASFTGNVSGVIVAFEHVLFNIIGVVTVYPIPPLRRIPIILAERLGKASERSRKVAFIYIVGTFFVIPICVIFVSRLLS